MDGALTPPNPAGDPGGKGARKAGFVDVHSRSQPVRVSTGKIGPQQLLRRTRSARDRLIEGDQTGTSGK